MSSYVSTGVTSYYQSSDGPEVQVFQIESRFANPANARVYPRWILDFEDVVRDYMQEVNDRGEVYLAVIDVSGVRYGGAYDYDVVNTLIDRIDSLPRTRPGYRIAFYYQSPGAATWQATEDYQPETTLGKIFKTGMQILSAGSLLVEGSRLKSDPSNPWVRLVLNYDDAIDWVREDGQNTRPLLPRV
ncbi:MAG: hypothetical protein NZM00_11680 [Anaerolinea sp.]|nr:hypothetical protein [Anaerolinea sp.]